MGETLKEQLRSELAIWQHNRKLYPGWLIAPYQTRNKIWATTYRWLTGVINTDKTWADAELLILYDETFWRMNLCLQYVPNDLIENALRIVMSLKDYIADEADFAALYDDESWPQELVPTREKFRNAWFDCAFQVLTRARINRDTKAFEEMMENLEIAGPLSQDQRSAIQYERSLYALSGASHEVVLGYLNTWPKQPEDPYWLIRRAAIFAELGNFTEARANAEISLKRLRKMRLSAKNDFWALSREGWCLLFIEHLDVAINRKFKKPNRSSMNKLEGSRCSPLVEKEYLEERIVNRSPPPRPRYTTDTRPDFDDGHTGKVHHSGGEYSGERLKQAINLLKASEVTAIPPTLYAGGINYNFGAGAFITALAWIREDFPNLWASYALRFGVIGIDKEEYEHQKKEVLGRAALAQMSDEQVEHIYLFTMTECQKYISEKGSMADRSVVSLDNQNIFYFFRMADLASRISLRLDDLQRRNLLYWVLSVVENKTVLKHPSSPSFFDKSFKRIISFLDEMDIQGFLIDFVNFPLQSNCFNGQGLNWPEPFDFISIELGKALKRPKDATFKVKIDDLLDNVFSPNLNLRSCAVIRLLRLSEFGLLSAQEKNRFAAALWKDTDDYGLPNLIPEIFKSIYLELPELKKGQAVEGLSKLFDSVIIENRFKVEEPVKGETKNKTSISSHDSDLFLENIYRINQKSKLKEGVKHSLFDKDRRKQYLEKILGWWQREREVFFSWDEREKSNPFGSSSFHRMNLVCKVLVTSVLGGGVPDKHNSKAVKKMLNDFGKMGASTAWTLPVLCALNPNQEAIYRKKLRAGLLNGDPDQAYDYSIACWYWEVNASQLGIPALTEMEYSTIFNIIGGLLQPAAYHLIDVVTGLVEQNNIPKCDQHSYMLTDAVDQAASILKFDNNELSRSIRRFDNEELPHLRWRIARLVSEMMKQNVVVGDATRAWWQEAANDSFVDVRAIVNRHN